MDCLRVSKALRSSLLGLTLSIGAAGLVVTTPQFAPAAVDAQPLPKEAIDPANLIGRGLASKADQQLKAEVASYARENLFGVTGDLIPEGEVSFGRAGLCIVGGQKGAVFEFNVHARAKIDVGTRKFGLNAVRKIWGVDTVQKIQVVLLPKEKKDGSIAVDVRAEIVSATASKERGARQRDANGFRDKVSKALREKLSAFTGEYDAKPLISKVK